ncbi:LPXTG cell wall anchor domain-containing protein [Actinoplanes sp. NPDC049118]|uniref:LPXTG cell wall anchor domain-containing protein n=1 Tax=Actinoplanes sp. NPDC049118 TaxID=3155769 RepID=UPI0033EE55B1
MTARLARSFAILLLIVGATIGLGPAPAWAAPIDLKMTLTGPTTVTAGGVVAYRMRVEAGSAPDAASIRAWMYLPSGVTFLPAAWHEDESGPCVDGSCTVKRPEHIARGVFEWTVTLQFDTMPDGTRLGLRATAESAGEEATPADNLDELDVTLVEADDVGLTAVPPAGPVTAGEPVTFDVIAKNLGRRQISRIALAYSELGPWFTGGSLDVEGSECMSDPGQMRCSLPANLKPGEELRIKNIFPTHANDETWGTRGTVRIRSTNSDITVKFRFAPKPGSTTSPPAPGTGGGLPVTGTATTPLALGGIVLLLAGTGALWATRRRRA